MTGLKHVTKVPSRSEVWKLFRVIDLTQYHETKWGNNNTYVNWARVWGIAMDLIGDYLEIKWHGMTNAEGVMLDYIAYADGSAAVCCSALVDGQKYAECTLAVMDGKNKPIQNPTAVDFQNTRQRCQTKVLAMLGLGLYLWENKGEWDDERQEEAAPKPKAKKNSAKKKAPAKPKATEKSDKAPQPEEVVEEVDDTDTVKAELKDKVKVLYASNWEADEAFQQEIRDALVNNDVPDMKRIIKVLDGVTPAAILLHEGEVH